MGERLSPGIGPDTILCALADGSCKTIDQLADVLHLSRKQISNGAGFLIVNDYAERIEEGCYRLTKAGAEAAERGSCLPAKRGPNKRVRVMKRLTFQQRVWTAICMSSTFTISDVVIAAANGERDPEHNAQRYIAQLRAAGYVEAVPGRARGTRPSSAGFKRFRLVRNTGPIAPGYRSRSRSIHDYNIGKDVPCVRTP